MMALLKHYFLCFTDPERHLLYLKQSDGDDGVVDLILCVLSELSMFMICSMFLHNEIKIFFRMYLRTLMPQERKRL